MGIHPLSNYPMMHHLHQWKEIGTQLFGPDKWQWAFVCPMCGKKSTVREHADTWGGGISTEYMGQKCPHCMQLVRPRPDYGPETCYRILLPPESTPNPQEYPGGMFVYVMPFWAPDKPPAAASVVNEIIELVGDPAPPPAPTVPPQKKGPPSGYGFKF